MSQPQPQPQPQKDPVQQAADTMFDKGAKLEAARQAVLLQDLAELAKADREKVRRLEEKRLYGCEKGDAPTGGDVGDIVVCDDYHHYHNNGEPPRPQPGPQRPSGLWGVALAGAAAGAAFIAGQMLTRQPPVPTIQLERPAKSTTTTIKRGFIIDLPGASKAEPAP